MKGASWLARIRECFLCNCFLAFQLFDFRLIGGHNARAIRFDDQIEKLINLFFGLVQILLNDLGGFIGLRQAMVPGMFEHRFRCTEQSLSWLKAAKQVFKITLKVRTPNRLSIARANFRVAEIVGMSLASFAFRPAGRKWIAAIPAQDETAQRKVRIQIFTRRRFLTVPEAFLNLFEQRQRNYRIMLGTHHPDAPGCIVDVSGIDFPCEQFLHTLISNITVFVARILRELLKETLYLSLAIKASCRVPFKSFLNNRCVRLVPDKQLAVGFRLLEFVANRR